jgi:hypothetical protein
VGVLVGVAVVVGVAVALAEGVELLPPGETGGVGAEFSVGVALLVELGFGVPVPGLEAMPPPGLGSGVGGGGLTGPGLPVSGTGAVDCEVVVPPA